MLRNVKVSAMQRLGVLLMLLVVIPFNAFGRESIRIASYNQKNYLIIDRLVEGK
jgi:hypothetical protein